MDSTNNHIKIRMATPSDAERVAFLCEQGSHAVPLESVRERLTYMAKDQRRAFFVAEDSGKVVGFNHVMMNYEILDGNQARIDLIVVDEDCQGKGVGRFLMQAAENWSKENGSKSMKLVSNAKRLGAHKFYEKIGYTKAKEQYQFKKEL